MQDSSLQKTIGLEMLRPKMIRAVLGMKHLSAKGLLERMVFLQNVNRSYTSRYRSSQSEKVQMDDLGATIPQLPLKKLQFTCTKNCANFGLINFISEHIKYVQIFHSRNSSAIFHRFLVFTCL